MSLKIRWRWIVVDVVLWCVAVVYIVYGVLSVPYHMDEGVYLLQGEAFYTAFVEGDVWRLTDIYNDDGTGYRTRVDFFDLTNPPLMNYFIGTAWTVAGYTPDDMPGFYRMSLPLLTNREMGNVPQADLMRVGRTPALILLSLSVLCVYGVGRLLDGRRVGYLAAALYVSSPMVLMHGRRAKHEVAMMFFGMLVVLIGVWLARRRSAGEPIRAWHWLLLGFVSALTLSSKFTGAPYIAGTFGALLLVDLVRRQWAQLARNFAWSVGCAVLAAVFYIAITPPLWVDTFDRLNALVEERREIVRVQLEGEWNDQGDMGERLDRAVTWQYLILPNGYERAWHTGLVYSYEFGVMLIALTGLGILVSLWRVWRRWSDRGQAYLVLVLTFAVWFASLMFNPLEFKRFYTPSLTLITVLTGIGVFWVVDVVWRFVPKRHAAVSSDEVESDAA